MRLSIGFVLVAVFSMTAYAKDAPTAPTAKNKPAAKSAGKTAKVVKDAKKGSKKVAAKRSGPKGKFQVRLLSYKQMARLSKPKRMRYLKDLRLLLVTMERYQKQYEVASNSNLDQLKEQVARLINAFDFMPEAAAVGLVVPNSPGVIRSSQPPATTAPRAAETPRAPLRWEGWLAYQGRRAQEQRLRVSRTYPTFNGLDFQCAPGTQWNERAAVCLLENNYGGTTFPGASVAQFCPSEYFVAIPSPERGTSRMSQTLRGCVPKANWDRIADRQEALRRGELFPPGAFREPTEAQIALVTGVPLAPASTSTAAPVAVAEAAPRADVATPAVNGDTATTLPPAVGDISGFRLPTGGTQLGFPQGDASQYPVAGGSAQPESATPAPVSVAPDPEIPPASEICEPEPPLVCSSLTEQDVRLAIEAYRASEDMACVNGGFLTRYSGPVGAGRGRCPAVAHSAALGAECATGFKKCNPVAFCVTADVLNTSRGDATGVFYPFCAEIPAGNTNPPVTELCAQEHARLIAPGAAPISVGTSGATAGNFKTCDPWTTPLPPGASQAVMDEWEALKASTEQMANSWCTSQKPNFQKAFCKECEVIRAQLSAMNRLAGDTSCAPVTGTEPAPAEVEAPTPAPAGATPTAIPEGVCDPNSDCG